MLRCNRHGTRATARVVASPCTSKETHQPDVWIRVEVPLHCFLLFTNFPRPVGIKEAALDSPTFRATAVHFSDQFEAVERWLDGLVKAAGKLAQEAASLEGLCNSFIHHCRPPNHLSEAILDHDYTILALRRLCEGAQDAWLKTLVGMKNTQSAIVDPIKVFLNNEIKPLKVCTDHF